MIEYKGNFLDFFSTESDQSENPGELIAQLMMSNSLYSTGPPEGPIFERAVVFTDQKTPGFCSC